MRLHFHGSWMLGTQYRTYKPPVEWPITVVETQRILEFHVLDQVDRLEACGQSARSEGNKAYPLKVGSATVSVYCHLTADLGSCGGGGWTLVMKINGSKPSPDQPSPVQSSPVQSSPVQSSPVQSSPVQSSAVQSSPVQFSPVQSSPVQSSPVQSSPVQSSLVQPSPVQTSQVQSSPVQSSPVQSSPVQSSPVQSSPVQSSPVQSSPVQSSPVSSNLAQSRPAKSSPVQSSPVQSSPVQSSPVPSSPVQPSPVQTSQVQSSPVQSSPVQSSPVQPSPVQTSQVQSSPVQSSPSTFHYDSSYWTDENTYEVPAGETGFDQNETKLPTYWNTPFTKICLGIKIPGEETRFLVLNKEASSLHDLISDGQYRPTSLGRDAWKTLVGGDQGSLQLNCNMEGFNAANENIDYAKARIGYIANEQNECIYGDSRIGFGTGGKWDDSNTCGNEACCSSDNGDKHIKAMGYILVQ
ncbi:hypothetical protein ACROYT_G041313 [Oculina patagonica]